MLAVLVAVVMAKRFTLEPIAALRDDVRPSSGRRPRVLWRKHSPSFPRIAKA
jgi:hypothetical protein